MKKSLKVLGLLLFAVLYLTPLASAQQPNVPAKSPVEQAAQDQAESWLKLIDKGNIAESWNQAAEVFKRQVTHD